MESSEQPSPSRRIYKQGEPENPFELKITLIDGILLAATVIFIVVSVIDAVQRTGEFNAYLVTRAVHFQISRYSLAVALVMAVIAVFLGIVRKDDVTPWFRRGAYIVVGSLLVQAVLGFILMMGFGAQPYQPEHLIYGLAAAACLPFFVFVETTAKKRPAMGSYIWGFILLMGIIVRAIGTGAA
jgi:hypothetical protein